MRILFHLHKEHEPEALVLIHVNLSSLSLSETVSSTCSPVTVPADDLQGRGSVDSRSTPPDPRHLSPLLPLCWFRANGSRCPVHGAAASVPCGISRVVHQH